jgi:hypothetical protein
LEISYLPDKVNLPKLLLRRDTMTSNSQAIIQDIRQEFEMLIEFVIGEQAQKATADQMERSLFSLLLALGAKLLQLFFVVRSEGCCRETIETAQGQKLPYDRDRKRDYFSIFGKIPLWRPYFYQKEGGGQSPLDIELGLGDDCYSDLVREISDYLGVYNVYHKSGDMLSRLLGLNLSTRVIEENITEDALEVEEYYAQKATPEPQTEAEILVVQADGKGVPIIYDQPSQANPVRLGKGQKRGRKKEAVVTTVYTIAPQPRTPQAVVDSFFDQKESHPKVSRPKPQNKHVWATLDGKEAALDRLLKQIASREGAHIQHRVALCDGCEALQTRIEDRFDAFTLVLDFIHADEYLWDVANSLLGENHPQRLEWMKEHTLQILSGQTEQLIAQFRQMAQDSQYSASQQAQLTKTANYFERNLPYMDYPTYLERGWPIASGVIEGACRHFVKDRCELSGMRWEQTGVEALLRLRAVAENGDWDDYHHFRKRQRHGRLYNSPYPEQPLLELQAIESNTSISTAQVEPVLSSNNSKRYHQLPLAA